MFSLNTTPTITVNTTGTIRIETGASGPGRIRVDDVVSPGNIDLHAAGDVVITGELDANASNNDGSGGVITVVSDGNLTATGELSARASSSGSAGASISRGPGRTSSRDSSAPTPTTVATSRSSRSSATSR